MASADDGTLYVELEAATEEELRRGLAEARAIFAAAGEDPCESARASYKREGRDMQDQPVEITGREHDLADLWWEAAEAAWRAIGQDWEKRQGNFGLWNAEADGAKVTLGTPFALPPRIEPHYSFEPSVPEFQ